jgi:hypothetical protein
MVENKRKKRKRKTNLKMRMMRNRLKDLLSFDQPMQFSSKLPLKQERPWLLVSLLVLKPRPTSCTINWRRRCETRYIM